MDIRTIRWPEEREAILEHIRLVHGPGDSDLLGHWYGSMPGFDPDDCFVIEGDNGEIAAHTMLIPRHVQFGESVLQASEVGVVGTLDTYRKQGLASALMDRAIGRMAERGDAVSILFGIPNFYERWGFDYGLGLYLTSFESSIETPLALKAGKWDFSHSHQRRTARQLGVTGKDITVRTFDLGDLPAVMAMYVQESARGSSIIARDRDTWLWQLNYMEDIGRNDTDSFLIAECDGETLGYLRMVTSSPVNWFRDDALRFSIIEFGGDDPDAADALLAEAASTARDYDASQIGLYVHPKSRLMNHALVHGASMRSFTGAGFIRLNDLTLTLGGMIGTLEKRLEQSPFAGSHVHLTVSSEDQSAEVNLGTVDGAEEKITLESPASDLVRLFCGWFGLGNLSEGSYALRDEPLLSALFPKGDPRVGIADLI